MQIDYPTDRYLVDEHSRVVDSYALFVWQSFLHGYGVTDPAFSFYVNRVFKEYLFLQELNETYVPLDVPSLMENKDAHSYETLLCEWTKNYPHIKYSVTTSTETPDSYVAQLRIHSPSHDVTLGKAVNQTKTLALLQSLADATFALSGRLLTQRYKKALLRKYY